MHTHEWSCRIKSARQKRRLVKTDRDKQLIKLDKRRRELWQQQSLLPMVPLENPYQRGWKRLFVRNGGKSAMYTKRGNNCYESFILIGGWLIGWI